MQLQYCILYQRWIVINRVMIRAIRVDTLRNIDRFYPLWLKAVAQTKISTILDSESAIQLIYMANLSNTWTIISDNSIIIPFAIEICMGQVIIQ